MKRILLVILLLLCLHTVSAENRVVTTPIYTKRNLMRIDKLEMNTERTAIHCTFRTLYPKDSRGGISSKSYLKGASGKIYKLIGSEGITLDEQIYSYEPLKIVLRFEPLDENEKIIHFVETSEEESAYSLSDIYTYKPEGVKPFICTIKGQVVGFDCKVIRLNVANPFSYRLADSEFIPVIDGKFELTKEYNFIEKYDIYAESENPRNPTGEFSTFYISEGVIHIVMNTRESKKGNEITGDISENHSYNNNINIKELVQNDAAIYKQYYDLTNEQLDLPPGTIVVRGSGRWNTSVLDEIKIISPEYTSRLGILQGLVNISRLSVDKDSFRIEMVKLMQLPDFYIEEAVPVIKAKSEANDRNTERLIQVMTEKPSISKFYELESIISLLKLNYPREMNFRYHEGEGKTYVNEEFVDTSKEKADDLLNRFLKVYADSYQKLMPYHPLHNNILSTLHNNRIEQATRFFEACSKINAASSIKVSSDIAQPQILKSSDEINSELERLKGLMAKAIDVKDDKATEIINIFATDYLPRYPNHEITNEIKKMIRIASDDRNPSKWKRVSSINLESLKAVFDSFSEKE